jgi:hypothetical protein
MPVSEQRDVIPFVNNLEKEINNLNISVSSWIQSEDRINAKIKDVDANTYRSQTAVVKADEAISEVNNATVGIVANRGQRLAALLQQMREQILEAAANQEKKGGGTGAYDKRINSEIDNAVAQISPFVKDGLKLDYRFKSLEKLANNALKELILPYKITAEANGTEYDLPAIENVTPIEGTVTILNQDLIPLFTNDHSNLIAGELNSDGHILFNNEIHQTVNLYFPAKIAFNNIPKDFVMITVEMMLEKNSKLMKSILTFQETLDKLINTVEQMQGAHWTADLSIVKNHQDIIKEKITPKSLGVEVKDGIANVSFAYEDNDFLSHFICEKYDDEAKTWKPYDGAEGIIPK